eukprot:TRINITY_DN1488_c0_g1_i3.p1 TRINITY_DN1488_c0_g1~~TRINITY_DN1488_c0_g1_i3.p1  ORF type:complete len:103 (-),score=2.16 TRINITY_DN1488_c0_g1_i3:149-457(-)
MAHCHDFIDDHFSLLIPPCEMPLDDEAEREHQEIRQDRHHGHRFSSLGCVPWIRAAGDRCGMCADERGADDGVGHVECVWFPYSALIPVSYTHLTLPTKRIV